MQVAGAILIAIVVFLLAAFPFMWIWNYSIVAALTVAKPINYSVAFWFMVFISLFFAGSRVSNS